ncbi:MAG: type II CAAX endopeptidase family protein [Candidatus Acidiferrales bacterium]
MASEPSTPTPSAAPPTGWESIFLGGDGLRAGWRLAIFLLIFFPLVTLAFLAATLVGLPLPISRSVVTPATVLTQEICSLFATIVASIVMSRIERRPFDSYGLAVRSAFGGQFWRGAVWGLVMMTVVILLIAGAGGFSFGGIALHGEKLLWETLAWATGFCTVGLWEEFFFRGYTLATLAEGIGFWPAASVLSAVFGAVHLTNGGEGWVGVPEIFLISMLFCLTLRRTGSLWFAVGLHAAWDFGQTFLFSAPDSGTVAPGTLLHSTFHGPAWLTGGAVGPEGSVTGVLVVVLAMLLFARVYPARSEQ